jgi:hypothetical protein
VLQAVEVHEVNRRDVERKRLRENQSSDHGQAQRAARFGAGGKAGEHALNGFHRAAGMMD